MFMRGEIFKRVTLSNFINGEELRIEFRRHQRNKPWTYANLDLRQRQLAEQVSAGEPGWLILSELAPVITLGRRTPPSDLGSIDYTKLGIEIHRTDRGGLATSHGPGQWVVFPVEKLERLTGDPRGVRKAVCLLLQVALEVGRFYESAAEIRQGRELGVWTPRGKFASVGIHIKNGVLLHGLAVNGYRTPTSFVGLRPCGLDAPVDFLLSEANEEEFLELGQRIIDAFGKIFEIPAKRQLGEKKAQYAF